MSDLVFDSVFYQVKTSDLNVLVQVKPYLSFNSDQEPNWSVAKHAELCGLYLVRSLFQRGKRLEMSICADCSLFLTSLFYFPRLTTLRCKWYFLSFYFTFYTLLFLDQNLNLCRMSKFSLLFNLFFSPGTRRHYLLLKIIVINYPSIQTNSFSNCVFQTHADGYQCFFPLESFWQLSTAGKWIPHLKMSNNKNASSVFSSWSQNKQMWSNYGAKSQPDKTYMNKYNWANKRSF